MAVVCTLNGMDDRCPRNFAPPDGKKVHFSSYPTFDRGHSLFLAFLSPETIKNEFSMKFYVQNTP